MPVAGGAGLLPESLAHLSFLPPCCSALLHLALLTNRTAVLPSVSALNHWVSHTFAKAPGLPIMPTSHRFQCYGEWGDVRSAWGVEARLLFMMDAHPSACYEERGGVKSKDAGCEHSQTVRPLVTATQVLVATASQELAGGGEWGCVIGASIHAFVIGEHDL